MKFATSDIISTVGALSRHVTGDNRPLYAKSHLPWPLAVAPSSASIIISVLNVSKCHPISLSKQSINF